VAAGPSAEDAIFVLQADEIDIVDVQEVGSAAIRVDVLFRQFETHTRWIGVTLFGVVNGQGNAGGARIFGGDGLAQVGGKRGNATLARQVVADKGDALDG
jgi:hypothetical protein